MPSLLISFPWPHHWGELRRVLSTLLLHRTTMMSVRAHLCPTLCNPMDYSLPGSSVHGIFLARILKWVAMPSSRGIFPLTLKLPKPDVTRHVDTVLFSPTKESLPSRDGQQERSREEEGRTPRISSFMLNPNHNIFTGAFT